METRIKDQSRKLLKFAFVGSTGAVINLSLIWFLTSHHHIYYMISALIAIEISIIWNFILNTVITFNYKFPNFKMFFYSMIKYHMASLFGLLINLSVLFILVSFLKINYIISETIAITIAFGLNYLISVNYVWYNTDRNI
jgi:dolichol-phosphate mannosyltransferase